MENIEDIISELKKGSHKAFKMIFMKYYPDLYRFAYAYLMNQEQAKDIVQDSFTSLWSSCSTLPENINLKSYLYSMIKHACLDHIKHLQIMDAHSDKLTEALMFSNTVKYEDNEELLQKIRACINELPPQQQIILKHKIIEGLSYKEIANRLDISLETIHTHIKRAYKYIRENIPE